MTRKDCELIARVANRHNQDLIAGKCAPGPDGFKAFCSALAIELSRDDWKFNENSFVVACGFDSLGV